VIVDSRGEGPFETRTLNARLRQRADADADATFLRFGQRTVSFGQLDEQARRYGNSLRQAGVERGAPVALVMDNSPEFVATAFAANRIGGMWIPTCTDFKGPWMADALTRSDASVAVVDGRLIARLAELAELPDGFPPNLRRLFVHGDSGDVDRIGTVELEPIEALAAGSDADPDPGVRPSDPAAVLWTSGTTGAPKGVVQSHHAWVHRTARMLGVRDVVAGDVLYSPLPLYNSGGWILGVLGSLLSGCPLGMDERFSVADFWDRCRFYGATQIVTLGAMHVFLWQTPPSPDDRNNPVRAAGCVPMPAAITEPFRERFGIDYMWQLWGNSEVMIAAAADRRRAVWSDGSAGLPEPTLDVRILDDDDRELPAGEVGEICIRPKEPYLLFSGYYCNHEATAAAFRNLWFHSGDLGRLNDGGELFFVDRKADFMRFKGRNVASFEVETALLRHPDVVAAGAHGVRSDQLESEDEVKACVVLREGADLLPEDLARFVNDTAPYYLVPRYLEICEQLPMTPTGRVQKFRLRERGVTDATWDREAAAFVLERG
jgi:crotonobetaine/carnitine-CoA ligase